MNPLNDYAEHADQVFERLIVRQEEVLANEFYGCVFRDSDFSETAFVRCRFVNCHFIKCDLNLMRVTGSSFTETAFEDCKMVGVDWTMATWGSSAPSSS